MKTYYITEKSIKISQLSNKEFNKNSLCPRDYRNLINVNQNRITFLDFIISKEVWKEIGSDSYMKKSKYRFLKTVNISENYLLDEARVEYCKPENKVFPKKWDILIVKDWWWNWLWEVWYYNIDNENHYDSLSSWIIKVSLKQEKKFYILWLLKSNHFKTYIDLNTAQGSTIRHSKKISLNYWITLPSINNHEAPEKIEKIVSLIVKNLLDKEEQIKRKNEIIDEKIEKELKDNQKLGKQIYKFHRISEIIKIWRLDTWLFNKKYKEVENLVLNYKNWYLEINKSDIKTWRTPKDYIYPKNSNHKNSYLWLTPKYIKWRQFTSYQYINTKIETNLKEWDLIFTWIWTWSQWHMILYKQKDLWKIYINQNCYAIKSFWNDIINSFVLSFLSSKTNKIIIKYLTSSWSVPAIYPSYIKKIKIPNFEASKHEEIAKEYYNTVEKNTDLNFENYLEREKIRNKELWIFQLSMEIFSLREILEDLVDKIIMDRKIKISFDY